ncbi:hypothetical protein EJB05_49789 [Eragrostis curvula]|uniref:Zinc finger PHD-type domain-containing protein n=1 Tax=Eragrostis curvula TaxID=38414 RepID=A0A5J9T6G5_9POAL|nr:hypothetical protein EJB05_49789 [Eragrostis curvula]
MHWPAARRSPDRRNIRTAEESSSAFPSISSPLRFCASKVGRTARDATLSLMFDDDDGVEPPFEAVDDYHFEYSRDNPVCFSILPLQFDENGEVQDCDSEKKVYLCGVIDKGLYQVHKKVVAWRLRLDCDQPNILILLSEGNWIRLLKPKKWYKDEIARSIYITLQAIHFVRKQGRDKRNLYGGLWDHLDQVFNKSHTKHAMDDLKKHHSLIKLFLGADPTFMKSKLLPRLIGNSPKKIKKPKTSGTKVQFRSDKSCASNNNYDAVYDGSGENNGDYICDGHAADNDDNDVLCALCDDGGKLLSCIGQCKRAFHPRKKDGRESKCKTLGYTSEELKGIGSYLCKNCKYKQHQCFKCGALEPSDEPNAKVFKCNNPSCGHFYHPKCVAKLLEPDDSDGDENCELAKRIMAGMSFTCPVHWCFECGKMEDRTQRAMQFAVCRRCPKSYHRECLPRGISFDSNDKHIQQRGWELSKIIIIYCLDHRICKATGNAKRDHIKFPTIPRISKLRVLRKKKDKMIGKRKRRIVQCSTKSVRVSNNLSIKKNEHTQKAAADSSFKHLVLKPESPAVSLQAELQIEPSMVSASGLSMLEAQKGQGKNFAKSSSSVLGPTMLSSAMGSKPGKRRSRPQKETSSRTSCSIAKKCVVISEGMFDHSVEDILLEKPPLDKDAELETEICQIAKDKDCNEKEKTCEHYSGKGYATIKVTSRENEEQNDVPRKRFVDKHAERNRDKLKSGNKRVMVWGENADGCNSVSGQEGDIYGRENHLCQRPCEHDSRSEGKIDRNGSTSLIPGYQSSKIRENKKEATDDRPSGPT